MCDTPISKMASLESGDSHSGQSSTTIVSDLTVGTTSEDDDSMADTSHSSSTISTSPRTVLKLFTVSNSIDNRLIRRDWKLRGQANGQCWDRNVSNTRIYY